MKPEKYFYKSTKVGNNIIETIGFKYDKDYGGTINKYHFKHYVNKIFRSSGSNIKDNTEIAEKHHDIIVNSMGN